MAHIPYGYRIERGKASVLSGQAEQIRVFLTAYVSGASIPAAGQAAGIPLSRSALTRILRSEVYLGTDYYPPIISRELYNKVQEALQKRFSTGHKHHQHIPAVQTRFCIHTPKQPCADGLSAAEKAALIYQAVQASETGKTKMTESEKNILIKWYRLH